MNAAAEPARAVLRHHSKTFSAAAALLAPGAHDAAAVVYRFCRVVDDLADDHPDPVALERVDRELRGLEPPGEIVGPLLALTPAVPLDAARQLVEGCRTDLGVVRLADQDALVRYGYLVAGTVGRLVCPLLGVTDRRAIRFAVDLGVAMQLSNIARDVGEDAGRGRIYLPATWLREAGLSDEDVLNGGRDEVVAGVVARTLDLAERYYASAELGFRWLPWRARLAVALAARRYRGIGRAVRARGAEAIRHRTVLGPLARLGYLLSAPWVALRAGAHPDRPHDQGLHVPLGAWMSEGGGT